MRRKPKKIRPRRPDIRIEILRGTLKGTIVGHVAQIDFCETGGLMTTFTVRGYFAKKKTGALRAERGPRNTPGKQTRRSKGAKRS